MACNLELGRTGSRSIYLSTAISTVRISIAIHFVLGRCVDGTVAKLAQAR